MSDIPDPETHPEAHRIVTAPRDAWRKAEWGAAITQALIGIVLVYSLPLHTLVILGAMLALLFLLTFLFAGGESLFTEVTGLGVGIVHFGKRHIPVPLGLIAIVIVALAKPSIPFGPVHSTNVRLDAISAALDDHIERTGMLPNSADLVVALRVNNGDPYDLAKYIGSESGRLIDAWGEALVYERDLQRRAYQVVSGGPDRKPGSFHNDDDIVRSRGTLFSLRDLMDHGILDQDEIDELRRGLNDVQAP